MPGTLGLPGLARARRARGWSQEQLARHSGVTLRTIRHYENLDRDPTTPKVIALAEALGVGRGSLYVDAEDEEPRQPIRWQDLDPSLRWNDLGGLTAADADRLRAS